MTEHHEGARRPKSSRPLTSDEERFFGAQQEEGVADDRSLRSGDAEHRADAPGAGAPAAEAVRGRRYGTPGTGADEPTEDSIQDVERGASLREREPVREPASERERPVERTGDAVPGTGPGDGDRSEAAPLFPTDEAESLRSRWDRIQTEFVDEPRAAVEKADSLVGDVMQRLADGFSSERSRLERHWDRGDGVSTEDLRVALKRYRSFFDRLLSI